MAIVVPTDYLEALRVRLADDRCNPQFQPWGAASVLVGHRSQFRMRWLATRLHLFIIAAVAPVVTVETLSRFTEAAMDYARQNKGGLPAGFQTGVAVFPALISDRVEPDAAAWAASRQRLKFACVGRPAVIDTGTGQVSQYRRTPLIGSVYGRYLRTKSALYFPGFNDNPA